MPGPLAAVSQGTFHPCLCVCVCVCVCVSDVQGRLRGCDRHPEKLKTRKKTQLRSIPAAELPEASSLSLTLGQPACGWRPRHTSRHRGELALCAGPRGAGSPRRLRCKSFPRAAAPNPSLTQLWLQGAGRGAERASPDSRRR